MRKINLMLGGTLPQSFDRQSPWIGVDRGAIHLLSNQISPLFAIGDFDSLLPEEKQKLAAVCPMVKKTNQNQTDFAFALDYCCRFKELEAIDIYGATGGRLDHQWANLALLNHPRYQHLTLRLIDDQNCVMRLIAGQHTLFPLTDFTYFSLIPLKQGTVLSVCNAKYDVDNLPLPLFEPNATSNEFIGGKPVEINVNQPVWLIYSKD